MGLKLIAIAVLACLCVPVLAEKPPEKTVPEEAPDISLRALAPIKNAHLTPQDWQRAVGDVQSRISVESLKTQAAKDISDLVPQITKALQKHPIENVLVTVAVYHRMNGKMPVSVSVKFAGLDRTLNQRVLFDILADLPEGKYPPGLVLDPEATSYLVFFIGAADNLCAQSISHPVLKQAIRQAQLAPMQAEKAALQIQALIDQQKAAARIAAENGNLRAQRLYDPYPYDYSDYPNLMYGNSLSSDPASPSLSPGLMGDGPVGQAGTMQPSQPGFTQESGQGGPYEVEEPSHVVREPSHVAQEPSHVATPPSMVSRPINVPPAPPQAHH